VTQDELDDLASSLFDAGRREVPGASAKHRTLEQALARLGQPRRRPIARFALVALAAALFGAFWLLPKQDDTRAPISAERARPRESTAQAPESTPTPVPPSPAATQLKSFPARERAADAGDGAARRKAASKPSAVAPPTLEAELAVLDRARTELAAGNQDAALASLDHYDTTLRGTHLTLEARLLRIQTLAAKGDRARAAALARELVTQHPDSPLAERARRYTALDIEPKETETGEKR
jgi:hypothetical protein